MNRNERKAWMATLKTGDEVALVTKEGLFITFARVSHVGHFDGIPHLDYPSNFQGRRGVFNYKLTSTGEIKTTAYNGVKGHIAPSTPVMKVREAEKALAEKLQALSATRYRGDQFNFMPLATNGKLLSVVDTLLKAGVLSADSDVANAHAELYSLLAAELFSRPNQPPEKEAP